MRLTFVSYPSEVDVLFEDSCKRMRWNDDHQYFRVKSSADLVRKALSVALYRRITSIDVFGHGSPGFLQLSRGEPVFNSVRHEFHLKGLELRAIRSNLAQTAFRFLGCRIAAEDYDLGPEFQPKEALLWLSSQLDGRPVLAPMRDVDVGDFGENGFTDVAALGLMSSE